MKMMKGFDLQLQKEFELHGIWRFDMIRSQFPSQLINNSSSRIYNWRWGRKSLGCRSQVKDFKYRGAFPGLVSSPKSPAAIPINGTGLRCQPF